MIEKELTGEILKVFYNVYNTLGYGFIESLYHNAMIIELVASGLKVETEKPIAVYYNDQIVGAFSADIVVEELVILELKAKERLVSAHEAQLINYLRSTTIEVGLLLNFGKEPEFKRKYFSNEHKHFQKGSPDGGHLKALFSDDPFESA